MNPKAQQILSAAREVFLQHGYGDTSMDTIARQASVSKATLYAHFGSKEELFSTIISSECQQHVRNMLDLEVTDAEDIERSLLELAMGLMGLVLSPPALAVYRILMSEIQRFPEAGRLFIAAGPEATTQRLSDYLERAMQRRLLRVDNPRYAAEQFLGMIKGHMLFNVMFGIQPPSADSLQAYLRSSVAAFLRAYGSGTPSSRYG